jgi:hypothetical protein
MSPVSRKMLRATWGVGDGKGFHAQTSSRIGRTTQCMLGPAAPSLHQ